MLLRIKTLLASISSRLCANHTLSGGEYWRRRTEKHGRHAVLNLAHPIGDFERVTVQQRKMLFPVLTNLLLGYEQTVLDFGCGPGRFTPDLAQLIGGSAIGMDISKELIALAPSARNVMYRVISENEYFGSDDEFDVVWVCLVLGGISQALLGDTVHLIERAVRRGGLLFLVENTSKQPDVPHWSFRSVEQYKDMFSSIDLHKVYEYKDLGQEISVMAGRRRW